MMRVPLVVVVVVVVVMAGMLAGQAAAARKEPRASQPKLKLPPAGETRIRIDTAHGLIAVALFSKQAPKTAGLVRKLAESGLYDGCSSRRQDCHSAAPPSLFNRCFNADGEVMSAE